MTVGFAHPAVLAALAGVPLVLARAGGSRGGRACRAAAMALLVAALAGPTVERDRPVEGACVVLAVDVSTSAGAAGRTAARGFLARLRPALGAGDLVGVVSFAAEARVLAAPGSFPAAEAALAAPLDDLDPDDTDLAAGVATAIGLCPAARQAAVVAITDGNETVGSVLAEVALARTSVPVFPVPLAPDTLPVLGLRRVGAPAFAPEGTLVPVDVVVESRATLSAAVAVTIDGAALPPRPVTLAPGLVAVTVPVPAEHRGAHVLEARVLTAPDGPPAPPPLPGALTVVAPLHVLVVSARSEPPVVARALERHQIAAEVVAPGAFASRVGALDAVHVVVLDDVARDALPDPTLGALEAWVRRGGGLVVTGGPHLFGDPHLVGTALERLLPVTLEAQMPEPRVRDPIALELVVDRSNSMGEDGPAGYTKMEYAERAALAVLDELGPSDLVGAIAFDTRAFDLGPLTPALEGRRALADRIGRLRHGGGTDWKEALELAHARLVASPAAIRHVILLTDGDTNRAAADHDGLIADLAAAGVTVTAIRIGSDAGRLELLARLARATGGEFHRVESMETLPQLMIRDAQRQMDASAGRTDRRARIERPGPMLAGFGDEDLPPIARWAVVRPRADAEVRLEVDGDGRRDPVLATWQYGLGRVAVLPLDFQSGAAGWAAWSGFAKLWSQLALWAAPRALRGERHLAAVRRGDRVDLTLETAPGDAGPFVLRAPELGEVAFRPGAGGVAHAALPPRAPGRLAATLVDGASGDATAVDVVVPPRTASGHETRALTVATARLAALAAATGGAMDPAPARVVAARGGATRERRPLSAPLVAAAMLFVLAAVAAESPRDRVAWGLRRAAATSR